MPAAIPIAAQIAAASIAGAVGLGGLTSAAIVAGAGMLGAYVASKIMGSDAGNHIDALANIKLNTSTTQRTVPLIYGEHKVGSNDVFIEVSKTGTKYLYIVHCLGEGECEGISQDKNGVDQVFVNEKLASTYKSGVIQYWFHSGTNTQEVDTNISLALGGKFTDPMINTSYVLFKIKYDRKTFSGIPSRTVILKGIKIYDYRTSTTAWSQNPALILYDYMTNDRYGLGWDTSIFDTGSGSTWESAANYCDINEACAGKPMYYIDYYVGSQMRSQSIIDTILSHFRGSLSWFAGTIYLTYTDLRYEAPIFAITDDDIARTPAQHDIISVSQPSSFGIPDGVLVKYYNKRNNWTLDDIPIGDTKGNIQQIVFNAFTDRGLALDLGRYTLERNRLNKVISLTARADLIELDINDVGVLQSSELGLTNQLVRVKESSITPDGLMVLSLILEDYNLYDSIYDKDLTKSYEVDLPNVTDPPPAVWNISFDEERYFNKGTEFTRLSIFFDQPIDYPWFDYIEVYYKLDPADDFVKIFNAADDFSIDPAEERATYYFMFVSVNTIGVRQDDEDAAYVQYQIGSSTLEDRPPSPTDVVIVGKDFLITGPENDEGLEYEIRIGTTAVGEDDIFGEAMTLFVIRSKSTRIPIGSLRPGTFNVWAATYKDNNTVDGIYCSTPVKKEITSETEILSLQTFLISYAPLSFASGTNIGTEVYSGTALRLLKDASYPMSGTWASYEYNTGYSGTKMSKIYVAFVVSRLGGPNRTWQGISGYNSTIGSSSWNTCFTTESDKTWNASTLNADKAAGVNLRIMTSTTPGGPYSVFNSVEVNYVFTRFQYFRLQVDIVDDSFGYRTYVGPISVYVYTT